MKNFFRSLILLFASSAFAGGSNPGLHYGQIPTAAQWNSYFASKLDYTPGSANTIPYWDGSGSLLNAPVSGDCTSAANVFTCTIGGAGIHAATSKITPVDADELPISDSASTPTPYGLKKLTFANLKAWDATYFANISGSSSHTFDVGTATTATQAAQLSQVPQFPFRNRIINSDMSVSQVNGGTAVTPTVTGFVSDQWYYYLTQASKLTFQQVADAPTSLKYSTKITVAAQFSPGATDQFLLVQNIEGQNIIDFQMGTAGAATIVTSEYIKGSVAGTYAVSIRNGAANRSYVGTVSVTTAWQRLSINLVGDTTGTWATDTTSGFQLAFDLGSGSNYNGTAGIWQAGGLARTSGSVTFVNQTVGSTLNITGVQVEAVPAGATQPTAFEFLPYETQLRRAQRYLPCWLSESTSSAFGGSLFTGSTTHAYATVPFQTTTRVPPTSLTGASVTTPSQFTVFTVTSYTPSAVALNSASKTALTLDFTITGATAGQGGNVIFNSASGQFCALGAQL